MSRPDELALVVKAIKSGLGGCVEWDHAEITRIRLDMAPHGLTAAMIRDELVAFVQAGGAVRQVKENRPQWKNKRDYYYKSILPIGPFKKGLFVEIELTDSDDEYPEVQLVNAHEQT